MNIYVCLAIVLLLTFFIYIIYQMRYEHSRQSGGDNINDIPFGELQTRSQNLESAHPEI